MFENLGHRTWSVDLHFLTKLASGLVSERGQIEVVEVGSFVGGSTLSLAVPGAIVHCVDTWDGSTGLDVINIAYNEREKGVFETFCRNMGQRLFFSVWPHVGESLFYAKVWPRKADLVFLDASHDYDSVKADIAAWAPLVKPGGILCGHDYKARGIPGADGLPAELKDVFPGVTKAADELGIDGVTGTVWWKRL